MGDAAAPGCMRAFGAELRQWRTLREVSLSELSGLTHYSKGYLSKIENGRKPVSPDLARRLDDALDAGGTLVRAAGQNGRPAVPRIRLGPVPRPQSVRSRLIVGRSQQLTRLSEFAAGVAAGRPGVAVLSGEPGIGKTWLAEAFAEQCEADGWRLAWGRCHETSGAPPLWPWHQIVRVLAAAVPPTEEQAPLLGVLLEDNPPPGGADEAGEARFLFHRATAAYLDTVAEPTPLLILIDDLQWADPASLGALSGIAALLCGRVALVTTVRSTESSAPLSDALGFVSHRDAVRIPLTGLNQAAVAELADLDDAVSRTLTDRTGGNPLFIRETLRLAEDEGMPTALTTVPEGVADVLRRRLDRLPTICRPVLDTLAVLGHGSDAGLLAEITYAGPGGTTGLPAHTNGCATGGPTDDPTDGSTGGVTGSPVAECMAESGASTIEEALDAAIGMRLITEELRFTHDLVRETVYTDIPARRRVALHLRALTALERRSGPDLTTLARHALAAGPAAASEAVRWASACAEQAAARHAHEDATHWWRTAVDAHGWLPDADTARHVELLLRLVRAQLDEGDAIAARQTRGQAVIAAARSADPRITAHALTSLDSPALWTVNSYGDVESQAVRRIEDTLAALPPDDSQLRCRLLGYLGMECYDGSDDPRCDSATAEALAMARRLMATGNADERLLAITLNARFLANQHPRNLAELHLIGCDLISLSRGMPGFELLGQMIVEQTCLEMYDIAAADRAAARAQVLIDRLNLPWPRFQHLIWLSTRHLMAGDFAAAEAAHAQAAQAGERLTLWYTEAILASGQFSRCLLTGTLAGAAALVDKLSPNPEHRNACRVLVLHAQGKPAEARRVNALGWPDVPHDWTELTARCLQGEAQLAVGDTRAAQATYEWLLPYEDHLSTGVGIAPAGPVGYYLGRLAADRATARGHFARALARCERAGLTWWATRIFAASAS